MDRRSFLKRLGGIAAGAALVASPAGLSGIGTRSADAVTLEDMANAARNRGAGLFGSTEIASRSFSALPQWRRVVERMSEEAGSLSGCSDGSCDSSAVRAWRRIIRQAGSLGRSDKIDTVNKYFNKWPYKVDRELYGTSEYWASPMEFLVRSGDCEDFAIAKFFALRELGLANDEIRVAIVFDRIRRLGHAVTVVYEGEDAIVLDSLSDMIYSHSRYKHYVPQYSMNETTRWAHVTT